MNVLKLLSEYNLQDQPWHAILMEPTKVTSNKTTKCVKYWQTD